MDFVNRRANGAAARMWAAAAESGIGPHDPLAPFIDAMADAAERIETVGDELKTAAATIAVAPPTCTDDNLRTLAHALRPDLHRLARAAQTKALVIGGLAHAMSSTHDEGSDGHGPKFMGLYTKLLNRYLRLSADAHSKSLDAAGIEVDTQAKPVFLDDVPALQSGGVRP